MIYTYYETENIDYWLSRSGLEHHRDKDHAIWLTRPKKQRLSLHEEVMFSDHDRSKLQTLISHSALCIIFVPELINDDWFKSFDATNVVFFLAGFLNTPELDQGLIDLDHWYRAVLDELSKMPAFESSYLNVADPSWPDATTLLSMPTPPHYIIDELCQKFDHYPHIPLDHTREPQSPMIQDRWQQIVTHPLFAEFYGDIRDLSWPDLEQLRLMAAPPDHVRQEILMSFQAPDIQNPYHRLDLVQDVLKATNTDSTIKHAQSEFHFYFFWSTVDLYHRCGWILDLLSQHDQRRGFDVLLGRKKKHRDLIYDRIEKIPNVVTYFIDGDPEDVAQSHQFLWPKSVLPTATSLVRDTTDEVMVNGVITSLSQIMPVEVYNSTAFSLVCESQCDNGFSFFTEKIIKPMLARRVFVVFSGQHYLRNLRRLGFRTFDGIIDESYDGVLRMEDRGQAVLDLINKLQHQDPGALYAQAQPILDHNFDLLMAMDWQQTMCDAIKNHVENFFINK